MGVGGDAQAGGVLTARLDLGDLVEEDLQVHHDAVADDRHDSGREHAGGQEVEGELLPVDDDGVAGVVAAVELHHVVDVLTELVSRLSLAFVAPLGSDDHNGWHMCSLDCRWRECEHAAHQPTGAAGRAFGSEVWAGAPAGFARAGFTVL